MIPGPPPPEARQALRQALFLDRDGVLNEEVNYLHDPGLLKMIPGAGPLIKDCNRRGVLVLVVTNQAGIGRGLYDAKAMASVNEKIARELAPWGAIIDGWYFCPHLPEAGCACRKPKPGLLRTSAKELGVDLAGSVMVGDKAGDLEAAHAAGVGATVLVRTGYGRQEEQRLIKEGRTALFDACRDSLAEAHQEILSLLYLARAPDLP